MSKMSFFKQNEIAIDEMTRKFIRDFKAMINSGIETDDIVATVYYIIDNIYQSNNIEGRTSCSKGCSWCCYDNIMFSQLEANYIKNKALDNAKINETYLELQNSVDNLHKLKFGQRVCPLLHEGKCSIYEHRPLVCRTHNSTESPELCKQSDDGNVWHGQFFTVEQYAMSNALAVFVEDPIFEGQLLSSDVIMTMHRLVKEYLTEK